MKKVVIYIFLFVSFVSCSSDLEQGVPKDKNVGSDNVTISSKPFVFEDDTRTILADSNTYISFAWRIGEKIGVFPVEPEGTMVLQAICTHGNEETETAISYHQPDILLYADFRPIGWLLDTLNTYAAFTPGDPKLPVGTSYKAVPVDMSGQDGQLVTIGDKFDYMWAPSLFKGENCDQVDNPYEHTSNEGHTWGKNQKYCIDFEFTHAISIVKFELTGMSSIKEIKLQNVNQDKVFVIGAKMNSFTGEITPTRKESSIEIPKVAAVFSKIGDNPLTISFYLAVLPVETGILRFTAKDLDGNLYVADKEFASKTWKPEKAYLYKANMIPANVVVLEDFKIYR